MTNIIDQLETGVNWNKVFGVVDSLYSDTGFSSNADNFARATAIEKAVAKFSDLIRVDQTGYDFIYIDGNETIKIELKMKKDLFYKGGFSSKLGRKTSIHDTCKFKVKSFLSEKKTVEDFREIKTFDYMMVFDLTARRVVLVEDEMARSLYENGSDGAMMELKLGQYYQCEIGEVNAISPTCLLSDLIDEATDRYLDF